MVSSGAYNQLPRSSLLLVLEAQAIDGKVWPGKEDEGNEEAALLSRSRNALCVASRRGILGQINSLDESSFVLLESKENLLLNTCERFFFLNLTLKIVYFW